MTTSGTLTNTRKAELLSRLSPRGREALHATAVRTRRQATPQAMLTDYTPHGAAAMLHTLDAPEVLISGPAGTGKSRGCMEKVHRAAIVYPGSRWLFIRKTRASLSESGLQTFEDWVLPENSPLLEGPQRTYRQYYGYPNGSRIVVGGMDKSSRVMSTEYDGIFVQEATELSEAEIEALLTRLRNGVAPWQQLIMDCNPDKPTHWLKQRCDSGVTRYLQSQHQDNPVLFDHETGAWTPEGIRYLSILDRLTGPRRARLRDGKWTQAEGAVYDDYAAHIHLIDPFPIPVDWPRYRAIDFGYTNPFVCGWWTEDPDGRLFCYRAIYYSQRLVEDHAQQIKALSQGEQIVATVADHDAEDRATLRRHGIRTIPAKKAVLTGIQAVQERLRVQGDGKARLYLFRNALVERDPALVESKRPTCTEEEFPGYVWQQTADGKPVKEAPVEFDDHGMDMIRYLVMYVDGSRRPGFAGARN